VVKKDSNKVYKFCGEFSLGVEEVASKTRQAQVALPKNTPHLIGAHVTQNSRNQATGPTRVPFGRGLIEQLEDAALGRRAVTPRTATFHPGGQSREAQ
jgi:hypothetical protein